MPFGARSQRGGKQRESARARKRPCPGQGQATMAPRTAATAARPLRVRSAAPSSVATVRIPLENGAGMSLFRTGGCRGAGHSMNATKEINRRERWASTGEAGTGKRGLRALDGKCGRGPQPRREVAAQPKGGRSGVVETECRAGGPGLETGEVGVDASECAYETPHPTGTRSERASDGAVRRTGKLELKGSGEQTEGEGQGGREVLTTTKQWSEKAKS